MNISCQARQEETVQNSSVDSKKMNNCSRTLKMVLQKLLRVIGISEEEWTRLWAIIQGQSTQLFRVRKLQQKL